MTAIDRRRLLSTGAGGLAAGLAASLALPARLLGVGLEAGLTTEPLYAAACRDAQGRFAAVVFAPETGATVAHVVLPERGHDIAVRPSAPSAGARNGSPGDCVAFARQPGNFAVVFSADGNAGREPLWFSSRADRHFHGHGVFSRNGRLLFTTENDFEAGRGVIGVRDAANGYQQIGEFASGGIDPHDLDLLADGRILVVANGGIKTHPAMPRRELNLATMQPNLAYIDTATGDLLERHELGASLHQLSIRHLSVGVGDRVLFGCQFKGPRWQTQPIIGRHVRGRPLELLALPDAVTLGMRNYVASVAVDAQQAVGIVTAPLGGMAVLIDIEKGRVLGTRALDNVFGASAATPSGFLLTNGNGVVAATSVAGGVGSAEADAQADAMTLSLYPQKLAAAWDNHVVAVR